MLELVNIEIKVKCSVHGEFPVTYEGSKPNIQSSYNNGETIHTPVFVISCPDCYEEKPKGSCW